MIRCRLQSVPAYLRGLSVLLGLLLVLAGCGGGPTVATSTGRILYLSTSNGIYAYSIMNDNTLQALSSQPLANATGSYLQIAATPGTPTNETSPLLLGANGGSSLFAWTIGSGGTLTSTTLPSFSGCTSLGSMTGVSATLDNQYLVISDGTLNASNIESVKISNGACSVYSTQTTQYPIQTSLNCSDPSLPSSSCDIFITLSSTDTQSTGYTPTTPEEGVYSESGTALSATSPATTFATCTNPNCPFGVAFNSTTLYFYASFNGTPSLQSFSPLAITATSQVSLTTSNLKLPCIDPIGGTAYIPTSNGYLYSVPTASGGTFGTVTTLLTPSSFGSGISINSCAVVTNP